MEILISVIITTYNRSNFLKETLKSIELQTYKNFEIIVVDDGSKECHASKNEIICNEITKCSYYFKLNTGQPDSRNFGIEKSKGNYIAFCDDDDIWIENKLDFQINYIQSNLDCYIVSGDIGYIDTLGNKLDRIRSHKGFNEGYVFKEFLEKNRTSSITPLLNKKVFDKVGFFNPKFSIAEDWEFWRKVSYFYEFHTLHKVLAYVRLHDNNMTKIVNNNHTNGIIIYKKLTNSLLDWGSTFFTKKIISLIEEIEWKRYRKEFSNRKQKQKIIFIFKIIKIDFKLFFRIIYLYLKVERKIAI